MLSTRNVNKKFGSLVVADGTSCRHQIHDGTGRERHDPEHVVPAGQCGDGEEQHGGEEGEHRPGHVTDRRGIGQGR